jgi:hypothetical protein
MLAAAGKQRLTVEAEGHAASIRAQGEAEAEIIFKKAESEAKAMSVKPKITVVSTGNGDAAGRAGLVWGGRPRPPGEGQASTFVPLRLCAGA